MTLENRHVTSRISKIKYIMERKHIFGQSRTSTRIRRIYKGNAKRNEKTKLVKFVTSKKI